MNTVRVKIEIPKGSNIKYEFNKKTGIIEVDRILTVRYPFNYGFIPGTLWHDGDALDAVVVGDFELHPGVEIEVEPMGIVRMTDAGRSDDKVVCALKGETVSHEQLATIIEFLRTYKDGVYVSGYTASSLDLENTLTGAYMLGGGP